MYLWSYQLNLLIFHHPNRVFGDAFPTFRIKNLKSCHFCMSDIFKKIKHHFYKTTTCMIRPHTYFSSKILPKNPFILNQDFHSKTSFLWFIISNEQRNMEFKVKIVYFKPHCWHYWCFDVDETYIVSVNVYAKSFWTPPEMQFQSMSKNVRSKVKPTIGTK